MLSYHQVYDYYKALDTTCLPPFHTTKSFTSWAQLYNETFKQYLRLRREGYLNDNEAYKLMTRMMTHVMSNTEEYKITPKK